MVMLLLKLNKAQRSVYSYVQGQVARGIGRTVSYNTLVKIGKGIRKTDYLSVHRYVEGIKDAGFSIASTRKQYFPDVARMPESLTEIRRNFSFNVRLDLRNTVTGETFEKNITVTSDRNMRISAIENEAVTTFYSPESGREETNVEVLGTTIVEGRKRAAFYKESEE